jgi:hypothetical protein
MKGVIDPKTLLPIAERAVEYWADEFEKRKEEWLNARAERPVFFGLFGTVGTDRAEAMFHASIVHDGEGGGIFWRESQAMSTAQGIVNMCENTAMTSVILTDYEIGVLAP